MLLKDIVQEISDSFEVEPPVPLSDGRVPFVFDGTLEVFFSENKTKDKWLITAFIGEKINGSNEEETKKLLKNVLQWHLARLKDHRETIAWDPTEEKLLLYRELSKEEIEERGILKHLEDFTNNLEFWNHAVGGEEDKPLASPFPLSNR